MTFLEERYTRVHLPALHSLPDDDWREPFLRDIEERERQSTREHLMFCLKMLVVACLAYGGTWLLVRVLV